jgi:predicted ribosomally synthesized peptide with nif11-like leader
MSVQKAKDFLVQIATDEDAAAKSRKAHEDALLRVAKELGYSFSAEDLQGAMAEVSALDELSNEELQRAVGGLTSLSLTSLSFSSRYFSPLGSFRPTFRLDTFTG